jgi:hypothetical protein
LTGVRAFPTFHFYLNNEKIDELQGADPGELERKLVRHRPKVTTDSEPMPPRKVMTPLERLKDDGKRLFTKGKYAAAAEAYTQAIVRVCVCVHCGAVDNGLCCRRIWPPRNPRCTPIVRCAM